MHLLENWDGPITPVISPTIQINPRLRAALWERRSRSPALWRRAISTEDPRHRSCALPADIDLVLRFHPALPVRARRAVTLVSSRSMRDVETDAAPAFTASR